MIVKLIFLFIVLVVIIGIVTSGGEEEQVDYTGRVIELEMRDGEE